MVKVLFLWKENLILPKYKGNYFGDLRLGGKKEKIFFFFFNLHERGENNRRSKCLDFSNHGYCHL